MKIGAVFVFVLAAISVFAAAKTVFFGANRPEQVEDLVGYAVGAFLVPLVLLMLGVWLWQRNSRDEEIDA